MTEREASREKFEVHMMKQNPCTRLSRFVTSPTDYKTKSVQTSWEVWQASRQQALEGREVVWKITPPMSRNAWFTDDPAEVEHFRKPGQGHSIEEFRSLTSPIGDKA